MARQLAYELHETPLFADIVALFKECRETLCCKNCRERNIEGVYFKNDSLTWIHPHVYDSCIKKAEGIEIGRQRKHFDNFLLQKMDRILEVVGITGRLLKATYEGLPAELIQKCKRSIA